MTVSQPPALEFPEMLHGFTAGVRRKVEAQGQKWAREYLQTGGFTQPQRMLQVPPGEPLEMQSGSEFDAAPCARWRVHMLISVSMSLDLGVPREERQRMEQSFETFCLGTPWGALYHAVTPPPPQSAPRMAQRFAALLRFWDPLQGPRYAFRRLNARDTLGELMDYIYRDTLEAWCPGSPLPVREKLALTAERMAHATREDCMEAMLRVMPLIALRNTDLQNRERLNDPGFQRERLAVLPADEFENASSADRFAVNGVLYLWDRELGRR